MTPQEIIQTLKMKPHPEGGFYAETFRDTENTVIGERAASTAIYYLLLKGQISHWHRVDAAEVWHYYAGAPLQLSIADEDRPVQTKILSSDIKSGARPQFVVKKGDWQSAQSLGEWTLVGCTVAPGFEMAPENWSPS